MSVCRKTEARFFAYVIGEFQGVRDLIDMLDELEDSSPERERVLRNLKDCYEDIHKLTRPIDPFEELPE